MITKLRKSIAENWLLYSGVVVVVILGVLFVLAIDSAVRSAVSHSDEIGQAIGGFARDVSDGFNRQKAQ